MSLISDRLCEDTGEVSDSSDDLEMPVLKAEVPWPLPPPSKTKTLPPSAAAATAMSNKMDGAAGKSIKSDVGASEPLRPTASSLSTTTPVKSLCDNNYESNEKPKTSDKCYYTSPVTPKDNKYCETASGSSENGKSGSQAKVAAVGSSSYSSPSTSSRQPRHASRIPSSDSDSDEDSEPGRVVEKVDPEQAFDRLVQTNSKPASAKTISGGERAGKSKPVAFASSTSRRDIGNADNDTGAGSLSVSLSAAASADDTEPEKGNPSSGRSPMEGRTGQRSPMEGRTGQRSPVKYEVSTSIWGKQIASYDLPDDYVNDYLREQQAKKIENILDDEPSSPPISDLLGSTATTPNKAPPAVSPSSAVARLLTSPLPPPSTAAKKVGSRTTSFDIIPACVPDSIGTEIDDIIQSGFIIMGTANSSSCHDSEASQDAVSLSSMTSSMSGSGRGMLGGGGRKSKRGRSANKSGGASGNSRSASGRRGGGGKKARQKSTDNLHPNLLPEDYLDEVIGQYFNQDDSSGDDDERQPVSKKDESVRAADKKSRLKTTPPRKVEAESSEDERPLAKSPPLARARIRPPASFFSMDFLEDTCDVLEWQEEEEGDLKPLPAARSKVKTELEIELEYKHILYGGKKRKGPKIGLVKKKKKQVVDTSSIKQALKPVSKVPLKGKGGKVKKKSLDVLKTDRGDPKLPVPDAVAVRNSASKKRR
jgi:hypothetical protein